MKSNISKFKKLVFLTTSIYPCCLNYFWFGLVWISPGDWQMKLKLAVVLFPWWLFCSCLEENWQQSS